MKTLPGIIAFLCWTAVLTAAENVSFVRPVVPGSCFQCRIQTVQSARYSFRFPGQEDTVVKQDTVRAEFRGFLAVQKVNAAGNPVRMRIRVDRIAGMLNGKKVQTGFSEGTWLDADLSAEKVSFTVNGEKTAPELTALLLALFPAASNSRLADLTGNVRSLPAPGEGWQPDLTAFLKMLGERQIQLSPADFKSGITYFGKEKMDRKDCRKFGLRIETARLADYDCRFNLMFWLAPEGPPVRMERNVTEVIRRVLRSDQPFAAGTQVELVQEDRTEQFLFPVSKIPALKTRGKKDAPWNLLLR